jgi:hypothetical protein
MNLLKHLGAAPGVANHDEKASALAKAPEFPRAFSPNYAGSGEARNTTRLL